jgi:sulfatase maturation enzyme AslB (radical SAM superfamily)
MSEIKTRREESANYSSVFFNGKTIRIPLDKSKPITELEYPEFYDISLGNKCQTGRCPFCYAKGNPRGVHYSNVSQKIQEYFGRMTPNQRPFQVAIGGQQEPLEHPELEDVLKTFVKLDIVPNYTTNGVLFDENIIPFTKQYCGGIAITLHPHLEKHWRKAIDLAVKHSIKTNLHFIVSDRENVELLKQYYEQYNGKVDYFVLLPHMNVGFAARNPKTIDYDTLEKWLDEVHGCGNIAFGANFYQFLRKAQKWNVSLYPPEILSKYLVCDDNMGLYNNSFEMKPVIRHA